MLDWRKLRRGQKYLGVGFELLREQLALGVRIQQVSKMQIDIPPSVIAHAYRDQIRETP